MERYNYQENTDISINDYTSLHDEMDGSYLDNILEHPFIDNLSKIIPNKGDIINIVCYRINTIDKYPYVEIYLPNNIFSCLTYPINVNDIPLKGIKRIKGYINHNKYNYVFIQIRDNNEIANWITLWDIIINKGVYGVKIHDNIVSFFNKYNSIYNLVKHNSIIPKPVVLYCSIHNKYLNYVSKNKSVQYCQNDDTSIINLHMEYVSGDNVRNICFIDDSEIENNLKDFSNEKYYILRDLSGCLQWIFKDNHLINSYTQ